MSKFSIHPYTSDYFEQWEAFADRSNGGTIFHRLKFLQYHGEKFKQKENHLLILKGNSLFGVLPLAIFFDGKHSVAESPYGASYGGPVFISSLNYSDSREIIDKLLDYLSTKHIYSCKFIFPIQPCYKQYSDTFKLALLEQKFSCTNKEISSVTYLDNNFATDEIVTSRARNMVRKAKKSGVTIKHNADISEFWDTLEKTYDKHGVQPTHTLSQLSWLYDQFPGHIYFDVALLNNKPIAGIAYFVINDRVNSSFYLCQNPEFQSTQALSLLIYNALEQSKLNNFLWFDFGTSSNNMIGNENLFRFKESFGAIGLFRETYLWINLYQDK